MMNKMVVGCAVSLVCEVAWADLANYVDPFVGTSATGHTFPGACIPFGMVQAGADTGYSGWEHCSGYIFGEKTICGFTQTHLNGTGCSDLCDVRLMPLPVGRGRSPHPTDCAAEFDKASEVAAPGYYAVTLTDPAVRVEIASTEHAAIYRLTAKRDSELRLLVEAKSMFGKSTSMTQDVGEASVSGAYRSKGWADRMVGYAVEFDRTGRTGQRLSLGTATVRCFDLKAGETLMVKVGLSAGGGLIEAALPAGCCLPFLWLLAQKSDHSRRRFGIM